MKNLALLKNAPNFAVILSLLLVAFELNQNQQSLLESNNLARIQAANNAFVGSTAVRQQQLENIEIWVKGSKMESLDENEEAVFRILCGSYIFNLGNLYEADFYSGNTEKINSAYIRLELFGVNQLATRFIPNSEKAYALGERCTCHW